MKKKIVCVMQDQFNLGRFIAIFENAYQELKKKEADN